MKQSHFSLSWDSHQKNICNGLSSLQQNGEFVDMTLAADGHMVKVHQVIIALASPYIKELIASANCPHPVVFLNNLSYRTLSSILEYIYTGEAMVAIEDLNSLAEAGRQLHIKGLDQMKINQLTSSAAPAKLSNIKMEVETDLDPDALDDEICYFEITSPQELSDNKSIASGYHKQNVELSELPQPGISYEALEVPVYDASSPEATADDEHTRVQTPDDKPTNSRTRVASKTDDTVELSKDVPMPSQSMQYTVSTQGSLQLILNRFLYYLKHTNRRDGTRQWRCVDYLTAGRCPAYIVTQHDTVLHRVSKHTHSFHDKKIIKKVQIGAVFSAIQEAVDEGAQKKAVSKARNEREEYYEHT